MQELFFITLIAIVAIVFGYTFSLERRTLKLEKKNGHEQHQIDQLKAKVKELNNTVALLENKGRELEAENKQLHQEIKELRERYEQKK